MVSDRYRTLGRRCAVGALLAVTLGLIVFQQEYRHAEAVLAAHIFSGTAAYASPHAAVVWFPGIKGAFGLEITPECSSALLIAPFTFLGAAMLWRRRLPAGRVALAVTIAAVLLLLGNQARVGLIAALIYSIGLKNGYELGHLVLGSLLSITFIAISVAILVAVTTTGRSDHRGVVTADA
ncbi:MAG: exosortase/archaeosortase family protein [Actinomycetota bacterium]|nr:exosortase/archaeosortase family protein [Actinomycetota bacterium]